MSRLLVWMWIETAGEVLEPLLDAEDVEQRQTGQRVIELREERLEPPRHLRLEPRVQLLADAVHLHLGERADAVPGRHVEERGEREQPLAHLLGPQVVV